MQPKSLHICLLSSHLAGSTSALQTPPPRSFTPQLDGIWGGGGCEGIAATMSKMEQRRKFWNPKWTKNCKSLWCWMWKVSPKWFDGITVWLFHYFWKHRQPSSHYCIYTTWSILIVLRMETESWQGGNSSPSYLCQKPQETGTQHWVYRKHPSVRSVHCVISTYGEPTTC